MTYILYARKSSEQEERQAMSIESQKTEMTRMTDKLGVRIEKIYEESMSAKKIGRPVFNDMLTYLARHKDCVVLAWKVDRLTRNIFDGARIIELLENGNIKEIRTIDKVIVDNPIDKFMLSIDFGVGKKYSDDLSVNVKRGLKAKIEKGIWPSAAPLGYLNDKVNKTIFVDEERAPYIRKAFDLYATGGYSVKDVATILYESGFRTRSGRKVHKSKIHKLLLDPFYFGLMKRNGKLYQGNHESIVSKQLFDEVQTAFLGKTHSKKQKHFFHLRGKVRCGHCGCAFTATTKKGHDYYYCTNGKGGCDSHKKYLRSEALDKIIASAFDDIQFRPELIEMAYLASKEKLSLSNEYRDTALEILTKQLETVTKKQSTLLDRHLSDSVSVEAYEAKTKELSNEEIVIKSQLKKIQQSFGNDLSTLEPTKTIFLTAYRAKKEFLEAEKDEKRAVLEKLLWNLEIKDQELAQVSFKEPYSILKKSPKNGDFSQMLGKRDSNPRS